tara:strand:- start:194 stop:394 length:201 start_codon:yes stop_codon:yes gene_type:complete
MSTMADPDMAELEYDNWIWQQWDNYVSRHKGNPPVPFNIFELELIGQLPEKNQKNRGGIVSLIPWK